MWRNGRRSGLALGRYIGNDILVRCKFGERLTDNADANAERRIL